MNKFLCLLFFASLSFQSFTQTSSWERIYLKNVGHFDMPPTMEVLSGKYKVIVDEFKNIYGYDVNQLVIQQKGLNEFGQSASKKYARILFDIEIGNQGDLEKQNFNVNGITLSELTELGKTYKPSIEKSVEVTGSKLIEWFPVKAEKINSYSCLHISYKRQLNNRPQVMVNMYLFMNNDRQYILTMSYRINEEDYWKADLEKTLDSLVITNIE